jgi:hypothetical protein
MVDYLVCRCLPADVRDHQGKLGFGVGYRTYCRRRTCGHLLRGGALLPRPTVDWDTSQADDFRERARWPHVGFGPSRHFAPPHDFGRKPEIAEVDGQPSIAEGDARDPFLTSQNAGAERPWLTPKTGDDTISAHCFVIDRQQPKNIGALQVALELEGKIRSVEQGVPSHISKER